NKGAKAQAECRLFGVMPAISAPEEALGGTKKTFSLILYQHVGFLRRPPDWAPREMRVSSASGQQKGRRLVSAGLDAAG
ncbi:MAG: hypothetical protein WBP66_00130, partial [Azonexus sp.]